MNATQQGMSENRICIGRRVAWGLVALLALGRVGPAAEEPDPQEQVLAFLQRLGLEQLEMLHIETVLQQPLEREERVRWAKQLGDLYAQRLMQTEGRVDEAAALHAKIERLVRQIPEADNPALQVMLLQAEYNQAEAEATRWLADPALTAARKRAAEILGRVAPRLQEYYRQLQQEVDGLREQLEKTPDGELREKRERELERQQAVLGRASYFAGWSLYYLGQTGTGDPRPLYQQAQNAFRDLLGIRDAEYGELETEWMQLESDWRCRAVIGLALSEAGLGNIEASRLCCELLEHASVPPEFQDQAAYWFVQGLLNAGRWEEAGEYAEQIVEGFSGKATQGKFSLCVSLVRAGCGAGRDPDPQRQSLGLLGLQGLARLGRQTEVRQLVEQYGISLDDSREFLLRWIAGQRLLAQAADSQAAEDYRAAADALQAALDSPDASQQVSSAAACRFELAWCQFQLGEYDAAGRNFSQAVVGLKGSDRTRAAQAAWSAFVAYENLRDSQPRYRTAAMAALETLTRDFSSDPLAVKAELQLRKLRSEGQPPAAAIAGLEQIPENDPTYAAAQLEICLLRHRVWSEAQGADRPQAADALLDSCDQLLEIDRAKLTTPQIIRANLLAAEVLLAAVPASADNLQQAGEYLDNAAALVARLPAQHSLTAEYHYRRMQWAGKRDDDVSRREHAEWLLANAAGSVYELPALVVVARYLDQALDRDADQSNTAGLQRAYELYQRLAGKLGTGPEVLSGEKNARITLSRLAEYAERLGKPNEAAGYLDSLLAAFPKDRDYLRRSGAAHFQGGRFESSLDRWRILLAGCERGSDAWLDAKYHQIACLRRVDPEMAAKVLKQFRLLYPEMGGDAWRDKFQAFLEAP